jgi:hypothetical protein
VIRLTFKKDGQEILAFSLDNQGNYFNVVGNDSWFDYNYQKNGLSRKEPRLWAEMLKSGYAQNDIEVNIIFNKKEEEKKSFKKRLTLIPAAILLIIFGVVFLPSFLSAQGPKSSVLIEKTRANLLKEIKTGSGQFELAFLDLEFSGSFDRGRIQLINNGPGMIRESIWAGGFVYQKNQNGLWFKKRINTNNQFPFALFLKALLNPKISIKKENSSAGIKFIDSFYKINSSVTSNSGIVAKDSDYLLIVDKKSKLPIEIAVSKLFRPYLLVGKQRNVSVKFLNFKSKEIKIPSTSQAFQSRG